MAYSSKNPETGRKHTRLKILCIRPIICRTLPSKTGVTVCNGGYLPSGVRRTVRKWISPPSDCRAILPAAVSQPVAWLSCLPLTWFLVREKVVVIYLPLKLLKLLEAYGSTRTSPCSFIYFPNFQSGVSDIRCIVVIFGTIIEIDIVISSL